MLLVPREPNRLPPKGPVHAYQSFVILSPRDQLVRTACEQAGCTKWRTGWAGIVDERTELGKLQAEYIRTESGRTFTELRTAEGLTVFRFEPYQRCFDDHGTRPERYLVRGGDWRGNPRGEIRRHTRPADWVEDSAEHLDSLKTAIERG